MPPSEIRKEARESLKGKWKKAVYIVLAFILVSMLMGFVQGLTNEDSIVYDILEITYFIINVPLSFGLIISFIKLKRNEEVSAFNFVKEGFSRFVRSWGIWFHTFIRLLLPIICMILSILLLVTLYTVNIITQSNPILIWLVVALFIATIIYLACRSLLYILPYFISFDNPELSSKECVKKSEELMKGNRGNYFMLQLSFIGWSILAVCTFGIGMLWLTPYISVAEVCFYERVLKNKDTKKVEK